MLGCLRCCASSMTLRSFGVFEQRPWVVLEASRCPCACSGSAAAARIGRATVPCANQSLRQPTLVPLNPCAA